MVIKFSPTIYSLLYKHYSKNANSIEFHRKGREMKAVENFSHVFPSGMLHSIDFVHFFCFFYSQLNSAPKCRKNIRKKNINREKYFQIMCDVWFYIKYIATDNE